MITAIAIDVKDAMSAVVNLTPITIVSGPHGSGKSRLLRILWSVLSSVGKDVRGVFNWAGRVNLSMRVKLSDDELAKLAQFKPKVVDGQLELEYSVETDGSLRQVVKSGESTMVVMDAAEDRSILRHPIELPLANAWVLASEEAVNVREDEASVLVSGNEEAYELARLVMRIVRGELASHEAYMMGPYFEFPSVEKSLDPVERVGAHGEGTIRALAELMTNPHYDNETSVLRKGLAKLGYRSIRIGPYGGGLRIGYRDAKGRFRIGEELPCHLKTILAISTQAILMRRGGVLFVENMDYCMNSETWSVLMGILEDLTRDGKYVVAEVHNYDLVKSTNLNSAIYTIVSI